MPPRKEKIVTVDDDPDILDVLDLTLSEHYEVYQANNGEEGLKLVQQKLPDLILCDYMMPVMNGREFCKHLKKDILLAHIPVIMLTGKGEVKDRIDGIEAGVDDYMVKPFSFDILIARIKSILRRPKKNIPLLLESGDVVLDPAKHEVTKRGKKIDLTLKEYGLLEYLIRNKGFVLNREQILSNIWDFNFDSFSNVVDVHINNLRRKLDDNGRLLKTVRGIGYVIND